MKQLFTLLTFTISIAVLPAKAQITEIMTQNFEGTFPPTGWSVADRDGDTFTWYQRTDSQTNNKMAASKSWDTNALTPNNYLITGPINLTGFTSANTLTLKYYIAASGGTYFAEHYKLVVSETGNTITDFDAGQILKEETLTSIESNWNWSQRQIDLVNYVGKTIYLAWVHYDCTDNDALLLDNVSVYEGVEKPYTSWVVGDPTDATPSGLIGGIVLAGGATDNNDAMTWFLNRTQSGDIVVIRASGADDYNSYLFSTLGVTVNSVETILIDNIDAANDPYVAQQIRAAEGLFIAGGDQYNYYQFWKDTPVEDAINYLINDKHAVVGGTSAGMAILGKVYYTPNHASATSVTALADPYNANMRIIAKDDFLNAPILNGTVCETHFDRTGDERDGRVVAFMARMATDWSLVPRAIACDEYTAVGIDETGKAYVFGDPQYDDYAYFLVGENGAPETCSAGTPLTWDRSHKAIKVARVKGEKSNMDYFDLSTWKGNGNETPDYWYVQNGTLQKESITDVTTIDQSSISVFPNPVSSLITITTSLQGTRTITLVDLLGKVVLQRQVGSNEPSLTMDVSSLTNGIYMLRVGENSHSYFHKIIIQH